MKNKQFNKTLIGKTGKDLPGLIWANEKRSGKLNTISAAGEIEIALLEVWRILLGHENFGVNDDFFQIGGNKIKAIQLVSRISSELLVDIQLADVFLHPTIAQLAAPIMDSRKSERYASNMMVIPRPDYIPLSYSQERLWFIDRLGGSIQYHLPAILRLQGNLNKEAVKHALQQIVNRHEVLRTVFVEEEGSVYQFVKDKNEWSLSEKDGSVYGEDNEGLRHYIHQLISAPFDLSLDYMLRAELITVGDQNHVLVVTMHHIASDAWSTSILVKEVVSLYNAFEDGSSADLPELEIQYIDYAILQRKYSQGKAWKKKIGYWKDKLEGVAALQLPTDYPRPLVQSINGASAGFQLGKELSDQLQSLSHQQGATLFMTLLAAFKVLLYRYSGQRDICVGTPIAGRQREELEGLIGFFVNTLALRTTIAGDASFIDLLQQVKATTLEAYEHQELPFEKVVEAVVNERDMSRSPLFQVMLVLQNTPESSKLRLGEVELSGEPITTNISKFDITFFISETNDGLQGKVEYSTDLYNEDTIKKMTAHFEALLSSVVKDPNQNIRALNMLTQSEEHQLLVEFNNTIVHFPTDKSMIDLFEAQVVKTPGSIALVFEDQAFTYKELNERSNQLGHYLRSKGVKEQSLVPICIERSAEMIVAILGILKAGGAYVPIDPGYPLERIKYMLEDMGAEIIITSKAGISCVRSSETLTIINIDADWPDIAPQATTNLQNAVLANHLVYVIYTSGSTGRPKGVMIEHKALLDHCSGVIESAGLKSCRSFALFSPLVFDAGHSMIHAAFIVGASLHILSKELLTNGEKLQGYINDNAIDCIKIVPSLWMSYADGNNLVLSKKVMIFGGESFSISILDRLIKCKYSGEVYNHYGPTEATIGKCIHKLDFKRQYSIVPIGKPFSNTRIYIVDQSCYLVPVGVVGELHIAGDGLAREYLNQPGLTAAKFIADPFSKEPCAIMYKTGDMARWLPDGNIEYLGRKDDQVKIRGYRIELGEIESMLQECALIKQAVVLAKANKDGSKSLVAYVVPVDNFDKGAIQSYLENRLPEYMVPVQWVALESLPLNLNGKIDRKALPDPDVSKLLSNAYMAPRNSLEAKLADIWQRLLQVERVGIHDNFFELGGHSLLAMRLVSAIRKELEMEMAIKSLFQHSTIAELAAHLDGQGEGWLLPSIVAQPRPEHIPLSFSQESLWFIDQLGGSLQYHLPTVLRLKGKLDKEALSNAMQQIINRHEALRTVILEKEGQGYQYIKEKDGWQLSFMDGAAYNNDDDEGLKRCIKKVLDVPFNLSNDYMLRVSLIELQADDHVLVVTLHHIASDGWSTSIFVKELVELYNAYLEKRAASLFPLPIQYADYALWQLKYLQGEAWDKKIGYWKDKLQGVAALQLPTNYPRSSVQSIHGAITAFQLGKELSDQLLLLSHQQGTTLFMTLLAAFKVLLYRYTGQQDICVGTPTAGRQQQELEGLIGFFVNTLALRTELNGDTSFTGLLQQVKATALEAFDNQDVPFEKVVEAVVKERDLTRNPLFQVMLVLQNTPDIEELRLGEVRLSSWPAESSIHTTSIFELTFNLTETVQGLYLSVEYCTSLFNEQTIQGMLVHFNELLNSAVKVPGQRIGKLPMLTQAEQRQLLFQFNKTNADSPKDKTIVDLFEEQAELNPTNTALVFEKDELTYMELNERSNQLAHYLRSRGVKPETMVPICIERSIEMLVGILGILKAGAAYVPIDPEYPGERIDYMLEDTAAEIVVTSRENRLKLPDRENTRIIEMDGDWLAISKEPAGNLHSKIQPRNLAYVIYTSGSTGKPKGVLIEHKSLAASTLSRRDYYASMGSFFLIPSFAFDSSVAVIFGTLISGRKLILCKGHEIKEPGSVKRMLEQAQSILCVPSYYRFLLEDGLVQNAALSTVILAGEKLEEQLVTEHFKRTKNISLYNEYGPTEGTVWSTVAAIEPSGSLVTIGKPIDSVTVFILNKDLQLVPCGVAGELCLGGVQIARGYLNLTGLTAEKFIANPFSADAEERIYKTGDLARWLPDGNIEYLGRNDDQVKINGYRIELGEIERQLKGCASVSQAVVLAKEYPEGSKRLVGYIVAEGSFDRDVILSYLKDKLPEYMVPGLWVPMQSFPLTNNGKINKKALPDPDASEFVKNEYVAPHTELEIDLVDIWQRLLKAERVGIHDNFFERGGHSLLVIRLVSAIRRKLALELTINDVFIYPTVASIAGNIIEKIKNPSQALANIKYLVPLKASGAKKPMFIVCGAGGTALRFKKFSDMLDENQPVFALQPPVDSNLKGFPTSIEAIAHLFIEEILIQNPHGPYSLSGHCLGGLIAFEMAKQLEARGEKVNLLAMFDAIITEEEDDDEPPTIRNFYHVGHVVKNYIERVMLKFDFETYLLRNHTRQAIKYKVNAFNKFYNKMRKKKLHPGEMQYVGLEVFEESSSVYITARKNYKITPYPGEIVLFYAAEHYYFLDRNINIGFRKLLLNDKTKNRWKQYAGAVTIHDVKGEHSTMFDPVHGSEFARLLQQYLDKGTGE